jgi:hypothetical protein
MKSILNFFTLSLICLATTNCYAQYYTGQKVFKDKFPTETKDYNKDTYIEIKNTSGDIIVAVENVSLDRVVQHAYIKSHDTYTFKNIPYGIYICKYMWTDNNGEKRYERDDSSMSFSYEKSGDAGGYVITLKESQFGNLSQSGISENEFFD